MWPRVCAPARPHHGPRLHARRWLCVCLASGAGWARSSWPPAAARCWARRAAPCWCCPPAWRRWLQRLRSWLRGTPRRLPPRAWAPMLMICRRVSTVHVQFDAGLGQGLQAPGGGCLFAGWSTCAACAGTVCICHSAESLEPESLKAFTQSHDAGPRLILLHLPPTPPARDAVLSDLGVWLDHCGSVAAATAQHRDKDKDMGAAQPWQQHQQATKHREQHVAQATTARAPEKRTSGSSSGSGAPPTPSTRSVHSGDPLPYDCSEVTCQARAGPVFHATLQQVRMLLRPEPGMQPPATCCLWCGLKPDATSFRTCHAPGHLLPCMRLLYQAYLTPPFSVVVSCQLSPTLSHPPWHPPSPLTSQPPRRPPSRCWSSASRPASPPPPPGSSRRCCPAACLPPAS